MIGLVTDSNTMVPPELRARFGIEVVPLTFTLDDDVFLEDGSIDLDACYGRLRAGAVATTAAPAPGALVTCYEALAARGATEIVSVHVGSNYSGTLNAAHVAAASAPVPVHLVDTGSASFAAGCGVWRAAEALAQGGSADDAVAAARELSVGSVFTVGELARARASGRLAAARAGDGVAVLELDGARLAELGRAWTVDDAVELMVGHIGALAGPLRVGVGDADAGAAAAVLAAAVASRANVAEVIRYRVGPSVAIHTGVGTVGAVYHRLGTS
jgi:DegV family protein with EDD domain